MCCEGGKTSRTIQWRSFNYSLQDLMSSESNSNTRSHKYAAIKSGHYMSWLTGKKSSSTVDKLKKCQSTNKIMAEVPRNEIRLVMIGKTGNGKSASCNTILGQDVCPSGFSNEGVTTSCMVRYAERFGKLICLVDTPDIQDSSRKNKDVQEKIRDCFKFTWPGPHAIILVVPIGRFTNEDVQTVKHFCSHFDEKLEQYVIVLFTRFDQMKREMRKNPNHTGMQGFIENHTPLLKEFLRTSADSQVQRLLDIVDNMVKDNGGLHYTNDDYQNAEKELQRQAMEIKKKNDQEKIEIEEKMRKEISDDIRKQYEQKQQELIQELQRIPKKGERE
ncbi:unnamed protein product [Mytilus coruscus]|uniref:AIG1-type G domain-containing protein n=1 Tax=Mytilus coruscus TaxID=42192 RepID=A0A6J8DGA4_MYTCO|nr:unnamed protein product [Mytilus coruscus]